MRGLLVFARGVPQVSFRNALIRICVEYRNGASRERLAKIASDALGRTFTRTDRAQIGRSAANAHLSHEREGIDVAVGLCGGLNELEIEALHAYDSGTLEAWIEQRRQNMRSSANGKGDL